MSTVSIGAAFYSGFIPLVKLGLCIGCGFYITKKGLFDTASSRGATQVAMKIALPCLVFASVIPSFNSSNIAAIGPILLMAALYEILGALMGFAIREIFYVPDDFRWGIIAACTCSNWGNLPTAVVQTVAQNPPFNSATDPELGTAYVSIFILVYQITFFASGLCNICAWDFIPVSEEQRTSSRKQVWRRRWATFQAISRRTRRVSEQDQNPSDDLGMIEASHELEKAANGDRPTLSTSTTEMGSTSDEKTDAHRPMETPVYTGAGECAAGLTPILSRYRSHHDAIVDAQTYQEPPADRGISPAPVRRLLTRRSGKHGKAGTSGVGATQEEEEGEGKDEEDADPPETNALGTGKSGSLTVAVAPSSPTALVVAPQRNRRQKLIHLLELIFTPITLSIFISLPIALVQPLKALFVKGVVGWSGSKIPYAPDGNPPLAFLLTAASFIGQICIPLSLILLGASLARIEVPKHWSELPWGSLIAVTLGKMVLMPCIGVGMVVGLTKSTTLFSVDDKILRFTVMFLSGGTSAVNQLLIAAIYSPTGRADTTAMYIGMQSAFMFISNSALAAVAIVLVK